MTDNYSIYARESSDDTNKAPPIAEQIARAKQYAEEQKYNLITTYEDNGWSGGDWRRPEWNRLVNEAKQHRFKIVIVFSQDRIARDTEQFLWFYRNLKDSYVKVYSITEGWIDLETVGGLAQNISMAMASHLFRKITSEKVKKTYESKKKEADKNKTKIVWGRKAKQYDTALIIQLRRQGLGYKAIANKIGAISYQSIRRVLQKALPENDTISQDNLKRNHKIKTEVTD